MEGEAGSAPGVEINTSQSTLPALYGIGIEVKGREFEDAWLSSLNGRWICTEPCTASTSLKQKPALRLVQRQQGAVAALASKRGEQPMSVINVDADDENISSVSSTGKPSSSASRGSSNALGFPTLNKRRRIRLAGGVQNQPSIDASPERCQTDIRFSNRTQLDMAIADLFHCENISDRIAESTRFALVLR